MIDEQQYNKLNIAFSHFLSQRSQLSGKQQVDFELIIKKLSFYQDQGHSCIYIDTEEQSLVWKSGMASTNELSPLILEQDRLYLHRYWFYENRLALQIKKLLTHSYLENDIGPILNRYFVELIDETDWQREAAKKVICQSFCMITGGPGTGKTTTIVKIIALLQEIAAQQNRFLHVAWAAPTGKAAMRLQESIGSSKKTLPCSEQIKQHLPEKVNTLHHLLGAQPPSPYFKHDAANPLNYDLVVIDEASMVDLALMSKLVDALKLGSRLILLGDKDQLASVESGAVLADLTNGLPEQTIELKKSYRFHGQIKCLADAVNKQSVEAAWEILQQGNAQVSLLEQNLIDYIVERYSHFIERINSDSNVVSLFTVFNQFQVLCSNRHGDKGVLTINEKVELQLAKLNKVQINGLWYIGRPVMVTQNNSGMQLYNGDIGICLKESQTEALVVYFLRTDGSIKRVLPSRMPPHETVYAMTIHKSQGSEFDECLCVLADKINSVLTKELVYTAITRAKSTLKIMTSYAVFSYALQQKVERKSGLFEKIVS